MKTVCAFFILVFLSLNTRADVADWFVVLDATNGFYASPGVPESAAIALKQAQSENAEIKSFAFTPTGDWLLLKASGFAASNDKLRVCQILHQSDQNFSNVNCLAINPSGNAGAISYQDGTRWGEGDGPVAAWNKVGDLPHNGHNIRSISYGMNDCWVVLYDKIGISYGNVPNDLAKVLDNAISNKIAILCVAFSGRDWICLAQNDFWWTSDTNLPAAQKIDQDFKDGLHPTWVAFVPRAVPFNVSIEHHIERTFRRRVQVSYDIAVSSPETKDGLLKEYALIPPDTEMQTLVACHVSCLEAPNLPELVVADEKDSTRFDKLINIPLANELMTQPLHLEISYTVDLYEVKIREGADNSGAILSRPTIFDTRATKSVDYTNADFQAYLREQNQIRMAGESNLAFAYRAYRALCSDLLARVKDGAPDTICKASYQCRGQFGGCGSCAMQYVAILRANGVPARYVVGRWAKNTEGDYGQWHVKTDFYDPTIGWIPVDPNFGWSDLRHGHNIDGRFGNVDAGFIIMHLNTEVHPWHSHFEMPGHQFGVTSYEGSFPFHPIYKENWAVKTLPEPTR